MKISKRFYVGSKSMNPNTGGQRYNDWAHSTLESCIKHAKELVEETGEEQIIVQVIRVVKPQKMPIIVEKL